MDGVQREPQMAAVEMVAGAAPIEPLRTDARAASHDPPRQSRGSGLFIKLLALGFWGTLATLIVSAAVAPGFAVLALLPLAGMPYLVFCWIAWTADRNVE